MKPRGNVRRKVDFQLYFPPFCTYVWQPPNLSTKKLVLSVGVLVSIKCGLHKDITSCLFIGGTFRVEAVLAGRGTGINRFRRSLNE